MIYTFKYQLYIYIYNISNVRLTKIPFIQIYTLWIPPYAFAILGSPWPSFDLLYHILPGFPVSILTWLEFVLVEPILVGIFSLKCSQVSILSCMYSDIFFACFVCRLSLSTTVFKICIFRFNSPISMQPCSSQLGLLVDHRGKIPNTLW